MCHCPYDDYWITFVICAKVNQRLKSTGNRTVGVCDVIYWKIYSCQDKSPIFTGLRTYEVVTILGVDQLQSYRKKERKNDTVPISGNSRPLGQRNASA